MKKKKCLLCKFYLKGKEKDICNHCRKFNKKFIGFYIVTKNKAHKRLIGNEK
jgi:hypothetical protein